MTSRSFSRASWSNMVSPHDRVTVVGLSFTPSGRGRYGNASLFLTFLGMAFSLPFVFGDRSPMGSFRFGSLDRRTALQLIPRREYGGGLNVNLARDGLCFTVRGLCRRSDENDEDAARMSRQDGRRRESPKRARGGHTRGSASRGTDGFSTAYPRAPMPICGVGGRYEHARSSTAWRARTAGRS